MPVTEPPVVTQVQDELSLKDVVKFLHRRFTLIVIATIIAAAAIMAYLSVSAKPVFTASVLLDPPPEGGQQELRRFLPSAQACQVLADSPGLARTLQAQMKSSPDITGGAAYVLRSRLIGTAPLFTLELTAEAPTAELAAVAANTWAQLFVDRVKTIISDAAAAEDKRLKRKLATINAEIDEVQKTRETAPEQHEQILNKILADYRAACDELLRKSEQLVNEKVAEEAEAITRCNAESEAAQQALIKAQQLQGKRYQLEATRRTYIAAWERLCAPESGEKSVEERRQIEKVASSCAPQIEALAAEIAAAEAKEVSLERQRLTNIEKLKARFAAEVAQLQVARAASVTGLQTRLDGQLKTVGISFNEQMRQAECSVITRRDLLSATLRADADTIKVYPDEVRIQSPATPQALPRSLTKQLVLAVFAGLFAGITLAVGIEVFRLAGSKD